MSGVLRRIAYSTDDRLSPEEIAIIAPTQSVMWIIIVHPPWTTLRRIDSNGAQVAALYISLRLKRNRSGGVASVDWHGEANRLIWFLKLAWSRLFTGSGRRKTDRNAASRGSG